MASKTLDNLSRALTIDLADTTLADLELPYTAHEESDTCWYSYRIIDQTYQAHGDPTQLDQLIVVFRRVVEEQREDMR